MNSDMNLYSCPLSPEEFLFSFYNHEWQQNSQDKSYTQAISAGRFTYDKKWKMIEQFCCAIGLSKPLDLQCGSKRFIGISLAYRDYKTLIEPILHELRLLRSPKEIVIYMTQLEQKQSLTQLEKKIVDMYWIAKLIFSPIPSLKTLCKNRCIELGLTKEEAIEVALEDIEQEEKLHDLPDLRSDLPPVVSCIIS